MQHRRDARRRASATAASEPVRGQRHAALSRVPDPSAGRPASSPRLETIALDDLYAGDVVVKVSHSTINFKDALAATGAGKILRKYPLVAGIDLAGVVVSSGRRDFRPGQQVLVNGCGLSETHDGGYAEYARVQPTAWCRFRPASTNSSAMAIGTAGYTAALAIHRMEQNGQQPRGAAKSW